MLNPTFPKYLCCFDMSRYIAPQQISNMIIQGNSSISDGIDYRTDEIFGNEIWMKLNRLGVKKENLLGKKILEVCGGGGFLTYHLLAKENKLDLVVNDISSAEITQSRKLINKNYPSLSIEYIEGDIHKLDFENKFDLIIGNSFLHHFYNVPEVLAKFNDLLNTDGKFITLHEPTPMATIVETGKYFFYPFAVLFPIFLNELIRKKYKGPISSTDLWLFKPKEIISIAYDAGYQKVEVQPWHLFRSLNSAKFKIHLSENKKNLSLIEKKILQISIYMDSLLNKILPVNFFGSVSIVCTK